MISSPFPATETQNKVLRDKTLDIIAGILIVRMILGHYMSFLHLNDSLLFYSMNILFFYMPGSFSNQECSVQVQEKT